MAGAHPRQGDDIRVAAQAGSASDRSRTGAGTAVGGQVPPPVGVGEAWREHGGNVATHTSLDTFSDSKFLVATGVSILTLVLTTVFGPLQAFLKTTSMDVRQWLICLAVALSIVVVSEIRKAVRRHAAPAHQETR
jgi:Cation transporting ATPase, C-terminus